MQTQPQTSRELIQALMDDPDLLDMFKAAVRGRAERPMFNMAGDQINLLAGPTGRVQVSPGQTISSASWGNPIWDQSVNCFASAADRDTQWPSPHDGSVAFQADTQTLWVHKAGAWHGLPMGVVGVAIGPTTAVSISSGTVYNTPSWPCVAGRRYRITVFANLTQQTSASTGAYLNLAGPIDTATGRFVQVASLPSAVSLAATGVFTFSPSVSGSNIWTLSGLTQTATMQAAANSCHITLEDMGS